MSRYVLGPGSDEWRRVPAHAANPTPGGILRRLVVSRDGINFLRKRPTGSLESGTGT